MANAIDQILTLVLKKKDASALESLLSDLELTAITPLSEGKAAEGVPPETLTKDSIEAALTDAGVEADYCLQSKAGRKKKLLICDMDSTLIGQECIDELADFAGFKEKVSAITERAMRGEIGFEGALTDRVALLKDLPLSDLQTCFEDRIRINEGAKTLCATMKANGAETVVVSGGFTFFSSRVAEAVGFENHHANILLDDDQALTGQVQPPILGREAKLERLKEYSQDLGGPEAAVAIGDGANDLAMITASGLGIAYYAKPAVAAAAHCAINHSDLRTALYFQGYKDSEFVEAG
ncbi:phosphoserine phosphatase SerB [Litorimonas haliclonae]|uniref:phosphoserine phosphatase SerB n=1 Tax=Litorimonas haliclonae TaxID=2081977 RepID=UPI0039EDED5A